MCGIVDIGGVLRQPVRVGSGRTLAQQRHELIVGEVRRRGAARVTDLASLLGVSDMTVRRDLDLLDDAGLVTKVHGGATTPDQHSSFEPGFAAKSLRDVEDKAAIARAAAARVSPGAAIGLSAGTTTYQLAAELEPIANLTVVTNSIRVAEVLTQARPDRTVVVTGGIRTPSDALVGPVAVQALRSLHLDVVFMGVHGMSEDAGYTTPNLMEADTNRAFIAAAQHLVVLADHTKWGVTGLSSFASLDEASVVISDQALPPAARDILGEQAGELVLAPDPTCEEALMATVTFERATRIYPGLDRPAVAELDLEIQDGEFLVLVGPSGCGKSTTLRMLAGLEPVDDGSVFIGDRDVTMVPPKDRDIAMVFQSYALYPHMTVAENIGFHLKIKRVPKSERAERVREAARILDLDQFLDRKPAKLSGGQRQRVAMGRAIVRQPQVFLMDEPLSNLDAKLRVQTRTQIAALQRRLGVTTVYVTHDQVEAMTMGDRVAVLRDGVLQQCASPRDLFKRPVNVFVAGFIGSPAMNLFDGQLDGDQVRFGALDVPVRPDQRAAATSPSVTIGVRPEGMALVADDGLAATVDVVEELGSESFLYSHVDGPRPAGRRPHRGAQLGAAGRPDRAAPATRGGAPVRHGDRRPAPRLNP